MPAMFIALMSSAFFEFSITAAFFKISMPVSAAAPLLFIFFV